MAAQFNERRDNMRSWSSVLTYVLAHAYILACDCAYIYFIVFLCNIKHSLLCVYEYVTLASISFLCIYVSVRLRRYQFCLHIYGFNRYIWACFVSLVYGYLSVFIHMCLCAYIRVNIEIE